MSTTKYTRVSFSEIMNCMFYEINKNKKNSRGIIFSVLFRFASCFYFLNRPTSYLFFPARVFYSIFVQYLMGIDISCKTSIGKGFVLYHGVGVVVHPNCIIGDDVIIRQCVTLGQIKMGGGVPLVGNNVEFGCNSVVLGNVTIGDNVKIGACCFVIKSVNSGVIVKGRPSDVN